VRRQQPPITYGDRQDRVWSVSEVVVLKVVSPAVDGPNLPRVIRFEHLGEERFARWLEGGDWRDPAALHRMFETVDAPRDDSGVGPAPPETVALWVNLVATMGPRRARGLRGADVSAVGPRFVRQAANRDRREAPRARR
jgi:hypothetical protein